MSKIFILLVFMINVAYANKVEISVNPTEPVMGDGFNVTFKIITSDGTDPIINFNPGTGLEVLSKEETGITTSTSYINGHLSVERSISIVYQMVATSYGGKYLKDISVEVNGSKIKHKNVRINVLKSPKKPKDILAVAVVDKDEAFVGESILVRYYLYNKVTVNATDIKRFPKLSKFLKRYHQEKMTSERVSYNGEIYTRSVLYTAQLFAEKPGEYKIDPITLGLQYYKRSTDYNGFGFGIRRRLTTTVTSKPIVVKIKALPVEGMPSHFSGLVGKHSFNLTQNKNKFLVNDPIELKVTVKGEGALELFELPSLFKSPNIEEFDASNELNVGSDFNATKTFNLTLLGRAAVKVAQTKIPISYFDPEQKKYVTDYLQVKPITVAGSSQYVPSQGNAQLPDETQLTGKAQSSVQAKTDLTPVYRFTNSYLYSSKYINLTLFGIILSFLSFVSIKKIKQVGAREPELLKKVKKEGVNFGRLHNIVLKLGTGHDMREIIEKSSLKKESKKYFLELISKCEKDYATKGETRMYKIKNKYLDDIKKTLERVHEDLS